MVGSRYFRAAETRQRFVTVTKEVVMEMKAPRGDWKRLGSQCENEPPGSFSNNEPSGRQVYVFGWHEDDGPAVWHSESGFDIENSAVRDIHSLSLKKIADLANGPFEMNWHRSGVSVPLRFRVVNS